MSAAGSVRAGGAFVEIWANDSKFQQAMTRVRNSVSAMAQTMQRVGTGMSLTGAGLGAPMVLAARQAAGFEDAILGMQGAANLSAADIGRLSEEAKRLGTEMGISPTKIANSMLALAKAGVNVQAILDGAGRSAVEFSRVGGVEVTRAADFMYSSMNVFGASAKEAVDTLVAAANSSPASIESLVESFAQVGSSGKNFGQSIFDVSQSLSVLARAGIVGEEAGTAVKTMLTKLVAPTQDAQEALGRLGLTLADFRDETGNLLPMQQIAGIFENVQSKVGGKGPLEKILNDAAIVDVFEQRGIKVVTAFANAGVEGFKKVGDEMVAALPVSEQFAIAMSGITGQLEKLNESVEQMSIAFGEAIGGPLQQTVDVLRSMMETVTQLIKDYPTLATAAAALAGGLVAVGTAAIAASLAMRAYAAAASLAAILSGPAGWVALAAALAAFAATPRATIFDSLAEDAEKAKKKAEEYNKEQEKAKNSVKRSEDKKPLDPAIFARQQAAEELAKEDAAFDEQQGKAIVTLQELSNSVVEKVDETLKDLATSLVDGVDELRVAAFDAGVQFQNRMREIMRQVDAGVLNAEGAQVLADQAKAQLADALDGIRQAADQKPVERDFGPSLGTFGTSGEGIGIGPELSPLEDAAKQTAANTARAANALEGMVQGRADLAKDAIAASKKIDEMTGLLSRGDAKYDELGGSKELSRLQDVIDGAYEKLRPGATDPGASPFGIFKDAIDRASVNPEVTSSAVGNSAAAASLPDRAAAARNGFGASLSSANLGDAFAGALGKVVAAIESQTKLTAEQTPLLKQIASGVENGGLAFS